ncbi:hypothetical protein D3C80_2114250 [compost metagenome]
MIDASTVGLGLTGQEMSKFTVGTVVWLLVTCTASGTAMPAVLTPGSEVICP